MERNKQIVLDEEEFINVPPELEGIEYGDALVVAEFPDVRKYTEEQMWMKDIRFKANKRFRDSLAEGFPLYVVIYDGVPDVHKRIMKENGYPGNFEGIVPVEIYVDQIRFADKMPGKKKEDGKKEKLTTYSVVNKKHDAAIIEEMIGKIDRERLSKLCSIAMGRGKKPSDLALDKYLNAWANAKYDWYVAFSRNLTISSPIEFTIDSNEMRPLIDQLCTSYPMYAANIDLIRQSTSKDDMDPFIKNEMPKNIGLFERYSGELYKGGMKVSRFLSALYKKDTYECYDSCGNHLKTFNYEKDAKDFCAKKREIGVSCEIRVVPNAMANQFDIDFSKVLQDRIVKGNAVISIDPYDFLTSGTNMHGWSTCQKLWGDMASALFSFITDPGCLIAYRDNGKEYTYKKIVARGVGGHEEVDFGKNAFVGNSKSWRQLIHCDPNTCTFLFSREYPSNKQIADIPGTVRKLLEDTISKTIGVEIWDNYGDLENIADKNYFGKDPVYRDATHHHYSDIGNWENLKQKYKIRKALVSPAGTNMAKAKISVGGEVYCLSCGRKIDPNSHRIVCGDCC